LHCVSIAVRTDVWLVRQHRRSIARRQHQRHRQDGHISSNRDSAHRHRDTRPETRDTKVPAPSTRADRFTRIRVSAG
jgi:hypothetical protein